MKFCPLCDNTMYIRVVRDKEQSRLEHFCKLCGATDHASQSNGSVCVIDTHVHDDDLNDYKRFMTPYLKYDPTLPRRDNIACLNKQCKSHEAEKYQVIAVKYDEENMRYLYCCETCDTFWRTNASTTEDPV
jgi:DNA-directed RNA polymerase subunit M/transcription elongation factor TFIIS